MLLEIVLTYIIDLPRLIAYFALSVNKKLDSNVYLNIYILQGINFFGGAFWKWDTLYVCLGLTLQI